MSTYLKPRHRATSLLILVTLIAGTIFPSVADAQRRRGRRRTPAPKVVYYTVPTNSVIRVRLNESLNSKTARIGDRFSTNVIEPVYAGGGTEVVPVGSKIWGHVSAVRAAGRRTPGSITVAFNQVELPSGKTYVINGSLASLEADNMKADNEGTVKGKSNKKRNAVFVGGGAAGGAIIGAIAGGGKGAAIGAILGGALGTGARVYEKEKDADVKSGTEFGVILNRPVSLPKA